MTCAEECNPFWNSRNDWSPFISILKVGVSNNAYSKPTWSLREAFLKNQKGSRTDPRSDIVTTWAAVAAKNKQWAQTYKGKLNLSSKLKFIVTKYPQRWHWLDETCYSILSLILINSWTFNVLVNLSHSSSWNLSCG